MDRDALEAFIVRAKASCYVGGGAVQAPSRPGSHDLGLAEGALRYVDSYFGGTDFAGQEVVWLDGQPVWAMNYYGVVTDPRLIDAVRAGAVIKAALAALYREGRFLGGFRFVHEFGVYVDENNGDVARFSGREYISVDGTEAYTLGYHGGLITA